MTADTKPLPALADEAATEPLPAVADEAGAWVRQVTSEWKDQQHDRKPGTRDGREHRRGRGGSHRRPDSRRAGRVAVAHPRRTQAARVIITGAVAAILAAMAVVVTRLPVPPVLAAYWISGAVVITACLTCFTAPRTWAHLPAARGRTLAIVPAYNEPPGNLEGCVRSLLDQTAGIDQVVVVDDGSAVPVVPSILDPRVEWIRQANTGKRGAQCTALRRFAAGEFEFVLTVDSDSRPLPDAVEHLLRAMSDPRVQAATGWLRISNYADSWVARAADIDIGGSCVMMRASRSYLGALETTSGALAMYRAPVVYDHLDEYEVECGTGDDRWLAMRALLRGEVVAVNEAIVDTDMPATLRGTYRQRIRWARSWLWMLPFCFARLKGKQIISPTYGLVQLGITPVVLGWAVFAWSAGAAGRLTDPWAALGFLGSYLAVRYALSALYLIGRPDMPARQKLISLIVGTPAAILLNLGLLMPVRYFALTRLNDNRWQTRGLS